MAATEDAEPSASGGVSAAANKVPPIFAQRDAYVAGGNIIFNGPPPGEGQPKVRDQPVGPGLGERLFRASVGEHSGKLAVAFGADNTLVVTDEGGAIYRWSLSDQVALPGAPGGGFAAPWVDLMVHGTSTQVAVSP